jgi:hypothetical protein
MLYAEGTDEEGKNFLRNDCNDEHYGKALN